MNIIWYNSTLEAYFSGSKELFDYLNQMKGENLEVIYEFTSTTQSSLVQVVAKKLNGLLQDDTSFFKAA